MPKRIPDEELTPEQLAKREKRRRYLAENRERISAQRRDYYMRNAEKIRERARLNMRAMSTEERRIKDRKYREKHGDEIRARKKQRYLETAEVCKARSKRYYAGLTPEQKKERVAAKRGSAKAWVERNIEQVQAARHRYYEAHREKKLAYGAKYIEEHIDELHAKSAQVRREKTDARKMCPAFRFTEYLRLKENARFVAVYRPQTNLAHKAAKTCVAIQNADYSLCPICSNPRIAGDKMVATCPIPRVFEFEDAIAQIRKFAKQIVTENKR